jgi:hypothetical protein
VSKISIRTRKRINLVGRVLDVGYHRNGVCGAGFWTVLFVGHKDADETVRGSRFVATRFDHGTLDSSDLRIAVLRVDDLDHGDANNCWRGDNFADEIDAIIEAESRS